MKSTFYLLAFMGWLTSLILHALSIYGINIIDKIPFIWGLHLGIFIVWIPAVIEQNKNKKLGKKANKGLYSYLENVPPIMKVLAIAGTAYAMINFILCLGITTGTAAIKNGEYVLENHGQILKTLTETDYDLQKARMLRLFSGHWIAFYGMATAIHYKAYKNEQVT